MNAIHTRGLKEFYVIIIYLRIFIDIVQYYGYFAIKNKTKGVVPGKWSRDFTILSTTLGEEEHYSENLRSWLTSDPKRIIISTIERNKPRLEKILRRLDDNRVHMVTTPEPGYRKQMILGLRNVTTEFIVLADDRVRWDTNTLPAMMRAFMDPQVGGVNTTQRVVSMKSRDHALGTWESFGALNVVRRNILHSSLAFYNKGQVLNLSSRTVAYRTRIFKREDFFKAFSNDYWRGKTLIRTGDDNFLTNWTLHHGWKTSYVTEPHTTIEGPVNADRTYLKQLIRWSRDTARYYILDTNFAFRKASREHITRCSLNWICNCLSDVAVLLELDFVLFCLVWQICICPADDIRKDWLPLRSICIEHLIFTGSMQLFEHAPFFDSTYKLLYAPGTITYAYIHAIVVLYSWATLNRSTWSSRRTISQAKRAHSP